MRGYFDRLQQYAPATEVGLTVTVWTGLRYVTNEGIRGHLYCSPNLAKRGPRYCAVQLTVDGTLRLGVVVAATHVERVEGATAVMIDVFLLTCDDRKPVPKWWPFSRWRWTEPAAIVAVPVSCVVEHAWLYPDMSTEANLASSVVRSEDSFWFIARDFFDRKGVSVSPRYSDNRPGESVENANRYLMAYQVEGDHVTRLPVR